MTVGVSVKPLFRDRHAAGLALAQRLTSVLERTPAYPSADAAKPDVVVLGLARGGVAVAAPIARALAAPFDTFIGRKLGVPGLEEVAFGAIAEGSVAPVLDAVHRFIGLPRTVVRSVFARELGEVARRVTIYRDGQSLPALAGRTVILVDDGLASGATLRAAGIALRRFNPAKLIAAVPVASRDGMQRVAATFDAVIAVATPEPFGTVSEWYEQYPSVSDAAVRMMLGRAPLADASVDVDHRGSESTDVERLVSIPTGEAGPTTVMLGDLGHPTNAKPPRGLVIFAHGGGSSRGSYRNRYLAARIRLAGWATLRLDLLGATESDADDHGDVRFDIALITRRLLTATRWCLDTHASGADRMVLFGASTGAAAAMGVAAVLDRSVAAVIARAGRIDLAREALGRVCVPTLLVVGSADHETLQRNRDCARHLGGSVTLREVPGAGHAFEESGALGEVGELATTFLDRLHRRDRLLRWWRTLPSIGHLARASAFSRDSLGGSARSE